MLIDTHCHIHESSYPLDTAEVLFRARQASVAKMLCVGTSERSSLEAVNFANKHDGIYAAIGVHPHDSKDGYEKITTLFDEKRVVAVGEIGLDYFYTHSSREVQRRALEAQLDMALQHNLPVIFHVRDAPASVEESVWDDFWPIFDNFKGIRGELHSYTDTLVNLEKALQRELLIGVNGISTFTKDPLQQAMFASIPLESVLLETDAPFLTPSPLRGKVNEPAFVSYVADYHATIRGLSREEVADVTTANAIALFAL